MLMVLPFVLEVGIALSRFGPNRRESEAPQKKNKQQKKEAPKKESNLLN